MIDIWIFPESKVYGMYFLQILYTILQKLMLLEVVLGKYAHLTMIIRNEN